jgi:2,3,4,5-tetrahydropyridine-2,6-dicarboxylate N-succinyltransferase
LEIIATFQAVRVLVGAGTALQANPTIVEDGCFIGARSEIAEGVVVETGAVISMGVFIGASTKIIDRQTGEIIYGRVPPYSVVVPGSLPSPDGGPALSCAVIVKRVDGKPAAKQVLMSCCVRTRTWQAIPAHLTRSP